jgi:hypothetical protein
VAAQERLLIRAKYHGKILQFGSARHKMWEEESKKTGKTPDCFLEPPCRFQVPIDFIEQEITCDLIPGVVLHGTPDSVSVIWKTIIDYKTVSGKLSTYMSSKQIVTYAYLMAMNNVEIDQGVYLCEVWNEERNKIIGYAKIQKPISMVDIRKHYTNWLKPRALLLKTAFEQLTERSKST